MGLLEGTERSTMMARMKRLEQKRRGLRREKAPTGHYNLEGGKHAW